jgi:ABC-type branched-subunit amino acid transport system ATPase component
MLQLDALRRSFGGLAVVRDCSLEVREGEIVGLIGPNGAGKTTVFNLVTAFLATDGGEVTFRGQKVTRWPTERIAQAGLVRTFQVPRLFEDLSVIENLLVAAPGQSGEQFWNVWLRPRRIVREEALVENRAWETLEFLNLSGVANDRASHLSGGQKKLLELGRALMVRPSMILLDEPVAGVSPRLVVEIADRLRRLRDSGVTLLVIEHKMEFIMSLADRLYVMADGAVLAEGTPEVVRANQAVLDAYLGVA